MWHPEMLQLQHPDWQELGAPDQKPAGPETYEEALKHHDPVTGCWISPFGEFYIRQVVQLVKQLDWDGANLDGFGSGTICYCKFCREAFRQDTGKDIPTPSEARKDRIGRPIKWAGEVGSPEFRRYLKWRLNRWTHYVDRLQKAVKTVKTDFGLVPWSTAPGRALHWAFAPIVEGSDAGNRLLDGPTLELFWDYGPDQSMNLMASFTARYYLGVSAERPVFFLPYFVTQGQLSVCPPPVECDFRVYSAIASGARVALLRAAHLGRAHPLKYYLNLIREREPWTTDTKTIKWAALLVSENSRLLYGISKTRSELGGGWIGSGVDTPDASALPPSVRRLPAHLESALGVYRAAVEDHSPIDVICDQDIESGTRLDSYRVLVLANAACLSDGAVQRIRAFVRAGGGLLAMHETSLYNEFGDHRADFALADVLGASYSDLADCMTGYAKTAYVAAEPHPITGGPIIEDTYRQHRRSLPFLGWTTRVKALPGSQVLAVRGDENVQFPKDTKVESTSASTPFLLASDFGKGRVAYFAADVGQAYFVMPFTHERPWLSQAMQWVAGDKQPPVSVQAPKCVQSTFFQQEKPRRFIVHLLNEINTTGGRALPYNNPPAREEVVPIMDIRVLFPAGLVKSAFEEPGHRELLTVHTGAYAQVTVPKLALHTMVVAQLNEK
jgi:uncharacterized membrane protein